MACHCSDADPLCEIHPQGPRTRTYPEGDPPPYLPSVEDANLSPYRGPEKEPMCPVGPWATGRVTWGLKSGLQGERPVVDKWSITKYSPLEWRMLNKEILDTVEDYGMMRSNVECVITKVAAAADKEQNDNTLRLQQRVRDIEKFKNILEAQAIDLRREIVIVMAKRNSMRKLSARLVNVPENIASECIDVRTKRYHPDLVKDLVEIELINERALTYEIRTLLEKTVVDLMELETELKNTKELVERDWSDKKETSEIDTLNAGLKNGSQAILFHMGATRVQGDQSSPQHWEHFSKEMTSSTDSVIKKARDYIRSLDEEVVPNALRDLREQADKVMMALQNRIRETDQARQCLERELDFVLSQIAEVETLKAKLKKMLNQLDCSLRVAQTRLHNRMSRLRVENCRDMPQFGLIEEVDNINKRAAEIKAELQKIEDALLRMYKTRATLENGILVKRKTLYLDQERVLAYRNNYPELKIEED